MDHHQIALVSIAGSSLDVLGAMYLAYDLLGGEHGPLRALTRGVTYGVIFAVGFWIALGPVFGVACGVTHGFTLAWEYSRESRGVRSPGIWYDALASAIRGLGFGIGVAWYIGPVGGTIFGVASLVAQVAAYRLGMRPTLDYLPAPRPRVTRLQLLGVINRAAGYGIFAGWLYSRFVATPGHAVSFGWRVGVTIGVVTLLNIACTPVVEWAADHIPERRMGVAGVGLILIGFSLQSVQYWINLLDIPVH